MASSNELWLPVDRLKSVELADAQPGQLIVIQPSSKDDDSARLGIRMKSTAPHLLGLTPLYGMRSMIGDIEEIGRDLCRTLVVDAKITIEANATAGAQRGRGQDLQPGTLVQVADGIGIVSRMAPNEPGYRVSRVINVETWEPLGSSDPIMVFGHWRVRIDLGDPDPIYWSPSLPTPVAR